jgi:hypothetical protein
LAPAVCQLFAPPTTEVGPEGAGVESDDEEAEEGEEEVADAEEGD